MNPEKSTAILIAGMHRSGTSALAGALGVMGVALGDRLLAPGSDNPKGYYEHQDVVAVHEQLLAALDRRWDDVRPLPDGWQDSPAARVASEEIAALIARDFSHAPLWAVKDPRICRFLPLWLDAVDQLGIRAVVLVVARDPSEVAASVKARNNWDVPIGKLLWLRHVLETEASSRGTPRAVVLYEDLLKHPDAAITAALDALAIHCPTVDLQRAYALQQQVDVAERHQRSEAASVPESPFAVIAQVAYEALRDTAHGAGAWHVLADSSIRLDQLWQDSGATIAAVADMAQQISLKAAATQREAWELSSKLNAQIQWSVEAVAIRTALREEHQVALESVIAAREQLATQLAQERDEHAAMRAELSSTLDELAGMRGSRSWKVTMPLRALGRLLRRKPVAARNVGDG